MLCTGVCGNCIKEDRKARQAWLLVQHWEQQNAFVSTRWRTSAGHDRETSPGGISGRKDTSLKRHISKKKTHMCFFFTHVYFFFAHVRFFYTCAFVKSTCAFQFDTSLCQNDTSLKN